MNTISNKSEDTVAEGYITLAVSNNDDQTAFKEAYALACSIKTVDTTRQVCLVTDKFDNVPSKFNDAFDFIVELPFGDTDHTEPNKMLNLWQLFYCSPFEKSMYLAASTIMLNNIDDMWDSVKQYDLVFPSHTVNLQHEKSEYKTRWSPNRKNNLPAFPADIFVFGNNKISSDFFKMADVVFQNWRSVYFEYLTESRPDVFDCELSMNIVCKMIDEQAQHLSDVFYYTDIGLDNVNILDDELPENWTDYFNVWLTDGNILKVNNHRQRGIVHYNDHSFLTQERFNDIRQCYKKSQKKITT